MCNTGRDYSEETSISHTNEDIFNSNKFAIKYVNILRTLSIKVDFELLDIYGARW